MSTYVIDYSDPLKPGFSIQPGSFDGPGGSVSSTSLRLYGRGALEWGESVDEDLVRLLENFAGSTPPLNPTPGQLWYQQKLYWRNTLVSAATPGIALANAIYQYNLGTSAWVPCTGTTTPFTVTVVAGPPVTAGIKVGDYVWDNVNNILYRWDSAYKQALLAWLPRAITTSASVPGSAIPEQSLQIQSLSGTFATPSVANATNATNSTNATNVNVITVGSNASYYVPFVAALAGNAPVCADAGITFNPSTNTLTVTGVMSAHTLASTVSVGTAPFTVTSTTPVANLSIGGNAATSDTAMKANYIAINDVGDLPATMYPVFVYAITGHMEPFVDSTGITFNPSTDTLTTTTFSGTLSGNATSATVAHALSSATTTVVVDAAAAPSAGQVLTATSSTAATWQTPGSNPNPTPYAAGKANNTTYQNTYGQAIFVYITWTCVSGGGAQLMVYAATSNPPTTVIGIGGGYNGYASTGFYVPAGWYYKVVGGGNFGGISYWTEYY